MSGQPFLEDVSDQLENPEDSSGMSPIDSDKIHNALQKLPADTLQLFTLHFDKGMTHPEISRETGIPIGTVKTKLRRGLVALRSMMRNPNPSQAMS